MKPYPARAVLPILAGLVVFVGVPIISWGLGDVRAFFQNPARLAYCLVTAILQIAAGVVLPDSGMGRGEGRKTVSRQRIALRVMQILSLAITLAAPLSDRHAFGVLPESALGRYIGLTLFALGFCLMVWATACLGKQFSVQVTLQEGHQLVTSGPYRLVRHPRYTGILTFCVGYALVFCSWLALVLVAPMALVSAWRIHDEEKLLGEEFQTQWDAYARRTRRLIPFVY